SIYMEPSCKHARRRRRGEAAMRSKRSMSIALSVTVVLFLIGTIVGAVVMDHDSSFEKREFALSMISGLDKGEYGGYYLDDDGESIHVNLLPSHPIGISESDMVKMHTVRYSLGQLWDLQEELSTRMHELHIQSLFVNTQENKLEVHVYQPDVDIGKRLQRYAPDSDMYKVVWDEHPIVSVMGDVAELTR
ncbi:MAG: hypothetical protein VB065_00815, partial [Eubacteriales bacterium]|nr:hypothetical protein [Eubacteriales bacterium]